MIRIPNRQLFGYPIYKFFNNFFFQINIDVIRPLVSPPLPPVLVEPLFAAFDENQVTNSINFDRIKPFL